METGQTPVAEQPEVPMEETFVDEGSEAHLDQQLPLGQLIVRFWRRECS